ncbi:MAG: NAD-dependent epimerase/dehydratase family protein [Thermoleophilia bacterium]|nr:NAD-dependent epimerase/dehydratase family protein [Thermoleophilia bacterium]
MRVIITGCAGFIGSHVAERMVAEGWRVTGIDAFTDYYAEADKRDNLRSLAAEPRFDLVEADLADAPLTSLLAGGPPIIHLAAQPGVRGSFGDGFGRYLHDNVLATQRLFEAALEAGCRRVAYASSSSVYGDAEAYPTVEGLTPRRPRSPYGVTKGMCEDLAAIYGRQGIEAVGLRYFTVYGPRQRPDMAMRRLCEAAHGGPLFQLNGDGSQSRDFTHVSDVVAATVLAATTDEPPPPLLNVGGGEEATMTEVIGILGDLSGASIPVRRIGAQRGDVIRTGADTTLLRALGWSPAVSLRDGLRSELEWVAARHGRTASAAAA